MSHRFLYSVPLLALLAGGCAKPSVHTGAVSTPAPAVSVAASRVASAPAGLVPAIGPAPASPVAAIPSVSLPPAPNHPAHLMVAVPIAGPALTLAHAAPLSPAQTARSRAANLPTSQTASLFPQTKPAPAVLQAANVPSPPPTVAPSQTTRSGAAAPSGLGRQIAYSPISGTPIASTPAPQFAYRSPAPNREYHEIHHLPVPGQKEIPDNQLIECAFTEDIDPNALDVGDTFTVAAEQTSRSAFGSQTDITAFPDGTLVEFVVTKKTGRGAAICRAKAILMPQDARTDEAIPVATASLLPPEQAGPGLNNRFEIARRGSEFGAKAGQVVGGGSNGFFWGDALSGLVGYGVGRARENAAGDSFVGAKIEKGTPCVVRINRRILFQ